MEDSFSQLSEAERRLLDEAQDYSSDLHPQDYLCILKLDFEPDSQLRAIRESLQRNRDSAIKSGKEIKEAIEYAGKTTGRLNEYACDEYVDLCHTAIYQDAAHSMAAVGMLAPFLETVFTQVFRAIGDQWPTATIPTKAHERWKSSHAMQWDCHNVLIKGRTRTDLVQGIVQLADATNLTSRLPADIEITLSALYAYRNKMFHCGFEWPRDERIAFQKRIDDGNWPNSWFATATTGGEPWIFYMSDEFIEHCLSAAEHVLTGFGEFVRDDLTKMQIAAAGQIATTSSESEDIGTIPEVANEGETPQVTTGTTLTNVPSRPESEQNK